MSSARNQVYAWGSSLDGQLGYGTVMPSFEPAEVEISSIGAEKIAGDTYAISCGRSHTAIVTDMGEAFTFGTSAEGQLGHGDNAKHLVPKRIERFNGLRIVSVACGGFSTTFLVDNGAVFTAGDVCIDPEKVAAPRYVRDLADKCVVSIACGLVHTICLTDQREVYTFTNSTSPHWCEDFHGLGVTKVRRGERRRGGALADTPRHYGVST
jgi:alpha-tubulin suppressor-like RCC1 family protein